MACEHRRDGMDVRYGNYFAWPGPLIDTMNARPNVADLRILSGLLDHALELELPWCEPWLAGLPAAIRHLAPPLRELLRAHHAGACAGFKAGVPNGHCLINKSQGDVVYLEIGTRAPTDVFHYSDVDMMGDKSESGVRFMRKNGEVIGD